MIAIPSQFRSSSESLSEDGEPYLHRPCPLCGQSETSPYLAKGELRLGQCHGCGMVFATPVRRELANGAFYDALGADFYLAPDKLAADYDSTRYERELRWFRRFCRGGAVLDVGCSTGAFLYQLKRRFGGAFSVCGMDVTSAALDYAESQGVPVLRGPFLDYEFGGRQFDAITFWAVLEHVVQPQLFLRRAAALLAPGGHLFVLVPNLRSLAVRCLGAKYRYLMPDHINYFTARTLRDMASRLPELECVAVGSSHFNPIVIAQDMIHPLERVPDEARRRLLSQTTALKRNPWYRPLKWVYFILERMLARFFLADNLILVLRKKRG